MTPDHPASVGDTRPGFRSGFVAVLGLPNVGKSTLVNAFLESSPLIVSYRAQTTRFHVRCISTNAERQMVFIDTPGWHAKGQSLGKFMRREISKSLSGADALMYLIDATRPSFERIRYSLGVLRQDAQAPLVIVVNKIDDITKGRLAELLAQIDEMFQPKEIVPVSALKKENLLELDRVLTALLPEGPMLYPAEMEVDKPDEFLFAEFIREQLYTVLREEVPFACAVAVEDILRDVEPMKVRANILIEKASQKGILIGSHGRKILQIRRKATARIKDYAKRPVELELAIKVHPKWSADERLLDQLGHNI